MATVWAHFSGSVPGYRDLGEIDDTPQNGWSHVTNFTTYNHLVAWLKDSTLYGEVSRLNINCHGQPGHLALDVPVNVTNHGRLSGLGVYLRQPAKLVFTGCMTGRGPRGSIFLRRLSELLPGRKIIAFELVSILGSADHQSFGAGDVHYGSGRSGGGLASSGALVATPRVTAWNAHSKWAWRGEIIRYPVFEQARRPNFICANPACPGHSSEFHQCRGTWNTGCEW